MGRKLLRRLITLAADRRLLLEVRTDNEAAIALYVSEGFVRLGIRRRYYQPSGADAYTMARPIPMQSAPSFWASNPPATKQVPAWSGSPTAHRNCSATRWPPARTSTPGSAEWCRRSPPAPTWRR